jgi:hypothetical protein
MNEKEDQAKQLLADVERLMEDLSQFLKSVEAASEQRAAMVNKLKEDHEAAKISWEHFEEIIEAAIEEEEQAVAQIEQLRDEVLKIQQACADR